jgi:hypothetical protein
MVMTTAPTLSGCPVRGAAGSARSSGPLCAGRPCPAGSRVRPGAVPGAVPGGVLGLGLGVLGGVLT